MKNWTVTFYVPYRLGREKLYTKINEYVSAETGAEAAKIAEDKACEKYEHPIFWRLDECVVSPTLANALDRFMSEEHENSADDIRDSLKPNEEHRIPILYSTVDLTDWSTNETLADGIDIQVYLNYVTGAYEIFTAGEWELAYVDGYYNDDELADDLRYSSFDSVYSEYADRVREWWMNHPKELYDWYDVTLPDGFEL